MRDPGLDSLQRTLEGLEQGLSVRHIASFDLQCCALDDDVDQVCGNPAFQAFDQVPVKDDGRIVGVLEFSKRGSTGIVSEHMRGLDDSLLVSADEPLASYVRDAGHSDYRLVVEGIRIQGIVTRTDLLKLPVRMLVFGLVTHLEAVMARIILSEYPDPERWLALLQPSRQERIQEKARQYRRDHARIPEIEWTDFCDKREIVCKCYKLGKSFERDLKHIEKLRNTLAHGSSYADTEADLQKFVQYVRDAERWIGDLKARIPAASERID